MIESLADAARIFAVEAHGGQRYGEHPYVVHLEAVAQIVRGIVKAPDVEWIVAVAYLHDVLEDTDAEEQELRLRFGDVVADAVAIVTDPVAPTRRERKALLHARLRALNETDPAAWAALIVKTADRVANLRACVSDNKEGLMITYALEHADFREAARRPGLCEDWWRELDALCRGIEPLVRRRASAS